METPAIRAHDYEPDPLAALTDRQKEVAQLVAGVPPLQDREVARVLGLSVNTVKVHMDHIRRTLKIRGRGDLVQMVERRRAYRQAIDGTAETLYAEL